MCYNANNHETANFFFDFNSAQSFVYLLDKWLVYLWKYFYSGNDLFVLFSMIKDILKYVFKLLAAGRLFYKSFKI